MEDVIKTLIGEVDSLRNRVAELEVLTLGMQPIGPIRLGPPEKTDEEIQETTLKAVEWLRKQPRNTQGGGE